MEEELLRLERSFWLEGPEFYDANADDGCIMVFAEPVGDLTKSEVIEAISQGPRWARVEIAEPGLTELSDGVVLLVYLARAEQVDGTPYEAMASSVYVGAAGAWKLAFHQQSPSTD